MKPTNLIELTVHGPQAADFERIMAKLSKHISDKPRARPRYTDSETFLIHAINEKLKA